MKDEYASAKKKSVRKEAMHPVYVVPAPKRAKRYPPKKGAAKRTKYA